MYKILIAEDEKDERDVILYLLKKYNFELDILQASNGRDAAEILDKEPVDILLTDIQMPFINGMELATKARSIDSNIEIIFFSGYDDFEYVKTALSLRAINYILKPVNPEEFRKSITDIITMIKAREEAKLNADKYVKEQFFVNYKQQSVKHKEYGDQASAEQDDIYIKNITQAIQFKNTDSLRQNTYLLLEKYKDVSNISHIYIRYLCTTLLQLFIHTLPEYNENDLQAAAEEIFTFRHFIDIRNFIESYLEKVILLLEKESQSPKHAIHLVEQYIHSHYMDELSLNTLASIVFLSPKYLSSMFIQVTGISINKYIKNVRMAKAQELLIKTNMKISDLCQEVGYSYVSYFCRSFQEDFGVTPEKYRQCKGIIE